MIVTIDDALDPRLNAFRWRERQLTTIAQRKSALNEGLFIAEGDLVVHRALEATALQWAKEINGKSPTAQRMLKFSFNLIDDGLVGQQVFAGEATRLAYMTDEAEEGRNSFLEKREPNWDAFPWLY